MSSNLPVRAGVQGRPIEQGIVARAANNLSNFFGRLGQIFGPGEPLPPIQPPQPVRMSDFPSMWNVGRQPERRETGTTFTELRWLAENCTLLAAAIETRKDQIARLDWSFKAKRKPGETDIEAQNRSKADPRIAKLETFWKRPDGMNDWPQFVRMLMEESLVTDALCLYGNAQRIEQIDGSTITLLLDDEGRTPVPPLPAYQQWIKGVPWGDFTTDEMIYWPRNPRIHKIYGYSPVEQIRNFVNMAIRRETQQLTAHTEGNIPAGICFLPNGWTVEQIEDVEKAWSTLNGRPELRTQLKFLLGGKDVQMYTPTLEALKNDFDEWIARVICYTFSLPAQWAVHQMNRATAETDKEAADEGGVAPWKLHIKGVIDAATAQFLGIDDVEFAWVDERINDAFKQAQIDEILVRNGIKTIDEVRENMGLAPLSVPAGIVTASGLVPFNATVNAGGLQPGDAVSSPAVAAVPPASADGQQKLAKAKKFLRIRPLRGRAGKRQPIVAAAIAKFLRRERHRVALSVASAYRVATRLAASADSADLAKQGPEDIVGSISIDWSQLLDSLMPDVTEAWAGAASKAAKGAGGIFDQVNVRAGDYATRRGAELVTSVSDTTRQSLRDLIEKAFRDGMTPGDLARAIEDSGDFSSSRAEMIARTELAKAQVDGGLNGWKEAGGLIEGKRSLLSSTHQDEDECDDAAELGVVPVDDDFGGLGDPPYHPNCECDVMAEVSVEEGE